MTIKSVVQLLAQADATIEDNTTGAISAADVRSMIKDFLDSFSPAYGAIALAGPASKALTTTPSLLSPFSSSVAQTTGFYVNSVANGKITRSISAAGLAGATDFIVVSGTVSGANNANVVVELYKNGVPTGFKTSVTCSGTSDYQGFNLAAITYTANDASNDAAYDLYVSGPAGNFNFRDVTLLVQAQPVRSYT